MLSFTLMLVWRKEQTERLGALLACGDGTSKRTLIHLLAALLSVSSCGKYVRSWESKNGLLIWESILERFVDEFPIFELI
jgi:hypothetical protein